MPYLQKRKPPSRKARGLTHEANPMSSPSLVSVATVPCNISAATRSWSRCGPVVAIAACYTRSPNYTPAWPWCRWRAPVICHDTSFHSQLIAPLLSKSGLKVYFCEVPPLGAGLGGVGVFGTAFSNIPEVLDTPAPGVGVAGGLLSDIMQVPLV